MGKLKMGDVVYLEPMNNAARRNGEIIKDVPIIRVGRKYFECTYGKFEIETGLHCNGGYTSNYKAYTSLTEVEEKRDRWRLHQQIAEYFRSSYEPELSLSKLKEINKIIFE